MFGVNQIVHLFGTVDYALFVNPRCLQWEKLLSTIILRFRPVKRACLSFLSESAETRQRDERIGQIEPQNSAFGHRSPHYAE